MKDCRLPHWSCKRAKDFYSTSCHSPAGCRLVCFSSWFPWQRPPPRPPVRLQKYENGHWKSLTFESKNENGWFCVDSPVNSNLWIPVIGKFFLRISLRLTRLCGRWCVHPPVVDELLGCTMPVTADSFLLAFLSKWQSCVPLANRYLTLCTKHQSNSLSFFKWTIQRITTLFC